MAEGLIIAGISLPLLSHLTANQTYRPVGGNKVTQMHGGLSRKQRHWRKYETSIDAEGWVPVALSGVDWDAAIDIHCIEPLAASSANNVVTVPRAFRVDDTYAPSAGAFVGGRLVNVGMTWVDSAATLAIVPGADYYEVQYFPILTVFAEPPEQSPSGGRAMRWTLAAIEVSPWPDGV